MKLIDNWQRTLTHGYAQWHIYAAIVVEFLYENVSSFSELVPGWVILLILASALCARIVRQESVSGLEETA